MSDAIVFKGLRAQGRIGVTAEERATPQYLRIDLELETDLGAAGGSDALGDTVDYSAVTAGVVELVRDNEVALLERLAELIAEHLLADDNLERVTVVVGKEEPPIPEEVHSVQVRIVRQR
ncbi:MAG: dihydroneopterin aldolase [Actinomycetota bacterium]